MASIQSVFVAIYLVSAAVIVVRGGTVFDDAIGLAIGCLQFICLILIAVVLPNLASLNRIALLDSVRCLLAFPSSHRLC